MKRKERIPVAAWRWAARAFLCAVATDLFTKMLALKYLAKGQEIYLLGKFLSLKLTHNPGAAFSLGGSATLLVTFISVLLTAGLLILIATRVRHRGWAVVLGIILGGAVGNLVDRFCNAPGLGRGEVVDFISYTIFVGNVADIWIVIGAIAALIIASKEIPLQGSPNS